MASKRQRKAFFDNLYRDPFQSPTAKPKHAGHQVNGQTKKNQAEIITEVQARKRN
ncbi:YpzG family protein [Aquibacillus sp. 3ASR75-11]|uniref:YpzG family protein n=1 Tax=Terrihalobacillus insolitus TaxID=2950438 RepID=A0A9X3WUX4_9BACI|nr:YpzG family protein [Terrihalobacillus insolitus]MDC3413429.1 YpzG family protein [Terrihalobacillus insolitus]MDC3425278.1 YpzG family protein [Terrihalobacillus insolitus]